MKTISISLIIFLSLPVTMSFGGFGNLEIHGFASTGYLKSEHNNYLGDTQDGCFEFSEYGLNVNSKMTEDIRVGMQIYAFDMGDIGNNQLRLDWAFLDYQVCECFGTKLGKFKMPVGLYNEVQDYDMLFVPVLLPQAVYTKYLRDTMISMQGASIYGNILLNKMGTIKYDIFGGAPEINKGGGALKYINTTAVHFEQGAFEDYVGGRIKWETPLQGLALAFTVSSFTMEFTGTVALPGSPVTDVTMVFPEFIWTISSIEYMRNNFTFSAEYSLMDMDASVRTPDGVEIRDMGRTREGYYAQISYRINSWLEAGTYYSVLNQDLKEEPKDYYGPQYDYYAWQKDLALSLRFNITDFWAIKIEQHFINGVFLAEPDNPPSYELAMNSGRTPGADEDKWSMFAVKTTFSF